jgi:hypothetical protein
VSGPLQHDLDTLNLPPTAPVVERADEARPARRWPVRVARLVLVALIAVLAIDLAVLVVPPRTVHLFGQTVQLGAVRPGFRLLGPGHLVLFDRTLEFLPTIDFPALIRPLVSLTQLHTSSYLARLTDGQHPEQVATATHSARHAIIVGWLTYFALVGAVAVAIAGALGFLIHRASAGHLVRRNLRHALASALAALLLLSANVGADYLIARHNLSDPNLAAKLFDLTTDSRPPAASASDSSTEVAMLGDSTVSGEGLPYGGPTGSPEQLCSRSPEAAAAALQVTGLKVNNLACSGATINNGILGAQLRYGKTIAPQLSALESMTKVKLVVVGVGADDVGWSNLVKICMALPSCDNQGTQATFDRGLDQFAPQYYRLLQNLQEILGGLDHRVAVVVNQYYDPFGPNTDCDALSSGGKNRLSASEQHFLSGLLHRLNTTLAQGATSAGFATAAVDFTGHQLCDTQSYVQGFADPAAFHPNAMGQLSIALADMAALPADWRTVAAGAPNSAAGAEKPARSGSSGTKKSTGSSALADGQR